MTLVETVVTLLILCIMAGVTFIGISVMGKETAKSYADKIATLINGTLNQSMSDSRDYSAHGVLVCTKDEVKFITYGETVTETVIQKNVADDSAKYLTLMTTIKPTLTTEADVDLRKDTAECIFGYDAEELKNHIGMYSTSRMWTYGTGARCYVPQDNSNAYEPTDDGINLYFDYCRCVYTGPSEIKIVYQGEEAYVTINAFGKAKAEKR